MMEYEPGLVLYLFQAIIPSWEKLLDTWEVIPEENGVLNQRHEFWLERLRLRYGHGEESGWTKSVLFCMSIIRIVILSAILPYKNKYVNWKHQPHLVLELHFRDLIRRLLRSLVLLCGVWGRVASCSISSGCLVEGSWSDTNAILLGSDNQGVWIRNRSFLSCLIQGL